MKSPRLVKDRQLALVLGAGCYILGSRLLWEAYEGRGRDRPWVTKLLPGG